MFPLYSHYCWSNPMVITIDAIYLDHGDRALGRWCHTLRCHHGWGNPGHFGHLEMGKSLKYGWCFFSGDFWVPEGKNRGLWDSKHSSHKVQLKKLGGRFTRHVDDWLVGTIFFLMTRFELDWKACWISQPMADQFGGPLFFWWWN